MAGTNAEGSVAVFVTRLFHDNSLTNEAYSVTFVRHTPNKAPYRRHYAAQSYVTPFNHDVSLEN